MLTGAAIEVVEEKASELPNIGKPTISLALLIMT